MSSALDKLFAADSGSAPARDLKVVASYRADVKRDSKGNAGFSIRPVLSDGTEGRFGDMWIRLAEGPATLRAFRDSLPAIYAAIQKLDAYMVGAGEWKADAKTGQAAAGNAAAQQQAAATVTKPKAAKPAPAPAPAPAKPADIFDDLPF